MHAFVPIACNQLATLLLGIVGLRLISQFVPAEVNGTYALFLTLAQIGALVTHSGLVNHTTRYWQRESHQGGTYARFLWSASWRGLRWLLPILLVLSVARAAYEREWNWLWAFPFLALSNLALALNLVATGALNADRQAWRVFFLTFVGTAARILIPVGLALATSMTFLNLSAGFALHGALVLGCIVLLFRGSLHSPKPSEDTRRLWLKELQDYGRPFLWLGIGNWLLQSADRWVVAHYFGDRSAGLFSYASQIGAIAPSLVVGGLMQWIFPTIFRKSDQAKTRQDWLALAKTCDRMTVLFLALTFVGLGLVIWVAPRLVGPLIRPQYLDALPMLIPAGAAMVTVQVNQFYYLLLQGQHNSAGMVKVMMLVSGLKTLGSVVAAAISWTAFWWWLVISLGMSAGLGRLLIRRMALREGSLSGDH